MGDSVAPAAVIDYGRLRGCNQPAPASRTSDKCASVDVIHSDRTTLANVASLSSPLEVANTLFSAQAGKFAIACRKLPLATTESASGLAQLAAATTASPPIVEVPRSINESTDLLITCSRFEQ